MEHLPFYLQLCIVLFPAALAALVMVKLRQPALIGYLLVGVALGVSGIGSGGEVVELFSELGIISLLFLVGLHMRIDKLLKVGRAAALLLLSEMLVFIPGGLAIGYWLGLGLIPSIILAVCLLLSSTIITTSILRKLGETDEPHGQTMIAVMLAQDIIGLTLVALLPTLARGGSITVMTGGILVCLAKAALLIGLTLVTGKFIFPHIFPLVEDDEEQLLIWPLGWALAHMALAYFIGFSPESAAFFAGLSISSLGYSYIVSEKVRSLASFGLVFFFVQIGSALRIDGSLLTPQLVAIVLLVLLGTVVAHLPASLLSGMGRRAAFMTGLVPAQISEFSLIVLALALKAGLIDESVIAMVTAATVCTMILSSLIAGQGNAIFCRIEHLPIFRLLEKWFGQPNVSDPGDGTVRHYDAVIYGADPDFFSVARMLQGMRLSVVILDPLRDRVREAREQGFETVKADYLDPDIVNAYLPDRILISTALRSVEVDAWTIHVIRKRRGKSVLTITIKNDNSQAASLKAKGWDIVVNPELEASARISKELEKHIKELYFAA